MLEWYFKNIKHPWIKLSFPALAFFDCIVRSILEYLQIHINWTESWVTQSAFVIWAIGGVWVIGGFLYLFFLTLIVQADKKNKEALLYIGILIATTLFCSLSPAAIEIH